MMRKKKRRTGGPRRGVSSDLERAGVFTTVSVPRRRGRKAKKTILEEYGEEREKVLEKLGGSKAAPFPRDAVQEALVLDARDRAAAKKRALVEDVPPPPVFDPFEDNLVRASVHLAAMASLTLINTGRAARTTSTKTFKIAETPATGRRPEDLGLPRRGCRCSISAARRGAASSAPSKQVAERGLSIWRARYERASSRPQSSLRRLRVVLRLRYPSRRSFGTTSLARRQG